MKKREEDGEDVPDPARVSEQRSHVASTRSAATGRRLVGCRESSATRSLVAGLGALRIPRHPARRAGAGSGGRSPPPTRDRPGRAPRRCAATSDTGARPRLRRRAGPRVRGACPRRTLSVSIASPSSNVSARRRWRRRRAYASRSSGVGPFSHACRRSRSRATHASISACVGSRPAALSVAASSDAWTVDPVMSTTPLTRAEIASAGCRNDECTPRRRPRRDAARATSAAGEVEPGRLELGVAVERVEALVAAEPRLLVAAERDGDVGRVEGVDPDDAGADRARRAGAPG